MRAHPVLVDLPRRTLGVVVLRLTLRDIEVGSRDDDIASVRCTGPLLAIDTMAQRGRCRLT